MTVVMELVRGNFSGEIYRRKVMVKVREMVVLWMEMGEICRRKAMEEIQLGVLMVNLMEGVCR